jgi:hypothetical protein
MRSPPRTLSERLRGHVSCDPIGAFLGRDASFVFVGLADDLIHAALYEAGRYGHILSAEAVAERPRCHKPVALAVSHSRSIVGRA